MKIFIIVICIGIIILAAVMLFKNIKNQLKGNGCGSCSGCSKNCRYRKY